MANAFRERIKERLPNLSIGATAANLLALGEDIRLLESSGAQFLHFDIMDGQFVPMLTVGPAFVKACATTMLKDVHLMVREPANVVEEYAKAGADLITIHPESCTHPHAVLQRIGTLRNVNDNSRPIARGVALNPSTPLLALEPFLDEIDMVTLVAVNPGFPAQKFIDATLGRFAGAREMIAQRDVLLCIDGGVTRENIGAIGKLGAGLVVTGSAVFKGDVGENVRGMMGAVGK
jgi:ribulose-phosphate 3-epimerase